MRKPVLILVFFLLQKGVFAQEVLTPSELSAQLTSGIESDRQKVEAIFRWITNEIDYRLPDRSSRKKKQAADIFEDDTSALLPLTERVARKVLQDRKAVCEGYARLFKSLCDHAGIRSVIISGYARANSLSRGERFRSNHTWNAVYLDSTWHLLDATWASGYIRTGADIFVRSYDPYYFLTPPELFARHHFPDDSRWTLLESPAGISELKYSPYRIRSFNKYSITAITPAKGLIEASVGDTLKFELQTAFISLPDIFPDSLWDELTLPVGDKDLFVKPTMIGNKLKYEVFLASTETVWINLMYNNDAILRYRVMLRGSR